MGAKLHDWHGPAYHVAVGPGSRGEWRADGFEECLTDCCAPGHLQPRRELLRHSLLVLQIGLAVMLLAAAGLLVRSFVNVLQYGSGFDPENTLTGKTLLTGKRYQTPEAHRNFAQVLLPRLEALPGVKTAALASALPLAHVDGGAVSFNDNPNPPVGMRKVITIISVTPDYFRAVGTSLFKGRAFDSHDTANSSRVAIVNLAFAKQFYAGDALGRQFNIGQSDFGQ